MKLSTKQSVRTDRNMSAQQLAAVTGGRGTTTMEGAPRIGVLAGLETSGTVQSGGGSSGSK